MAISYVCRSPIANKSCEGLSWFNPSQQLSTTASVLTDEVLQYTCTVTFTRMQRASKRNVCYSLCRHVTRGWIYVMPTRQILSWCKETATWKSGNHLPFKVQRKNVSCPWFGNARCRGDRRGKNCVSLQFLWGQMALHAPARMILFFIFPILLFKISHLRQQVRLTGQTEEACCCSMVLPSQDGPWEREGALTPCTVHDIPL